PTPTGPYHMWSVGKQTGGVRANEPPEAPGTLLYCEVPDIRAGFEKALKAGASEMMAPEEIPGGMGWMAIVQAPGGVAFGLWSMK
ncbi:MAG: hypothetical protein LC624_01935, partial [Halobacteriales archaeon]|nr:hypothetical protein [Halobacteriales archaeon]